MVVGHRSDQVGRQVVGLAERDQQVNQVGRLTGQRVEVVDRVDALLHHARRQRAVLVVPAVGRTVVGGQVPLRQVDVLTDDVGRRAHLEVVQLELLRHQVGVQDLAAVEGVEAHHQRLRRTLLGDGRRHVVPQRDDALLRVVLADLVEHRVDLHVGDLVGARVLAGPSPSAPMLPQRTLVVVTIEPVADDTSDQRGARVVDAGILEGTARYRQGTVEHEAAAAVGVGHAGCRVTQSLRNGAVTVLLVGVAAAHGVVGHATCSSRRCRSRGSTPAGRPRLPWRSRGGCWCPARGRRRSSRAGCGAAGRRPSRRPAPVRYPFAVAPASVSMSSGGVGMRWPTVPFGQRSRLHVASSRRTRCRPARTGSRG